LLSTAIAHANPASEVASAADRNNTADLHVSVDYTYEADKATIMREVIGSNPDPLAPIQNNRDLTFRQFRHTITPRATLGIYHDTFVSFALPIIIQQARELELASGLGRGDSSTVIDGLLPAEGFDANDPGTPLPDNLMFRGRNRSGLTQVHLGLGVAPMSQQRDPTKPTWKLGADVLLAVGKIMRFDALDPGRETGVNKGVHELRLWTSFARRFARTEGFLDLFWQVPLREREGSPFTDPGFGATNTRPGQKAGVSFGLEAYAIDDKANNNRISFEAGAAIVGHFEGRDYTEMWEVFAFAGDTRRAGPLVLDADPTAADVQPLSHPGITNFENFLETTAHFALRARLGSHAQFAVTVDLKWRTDHAITFADAGVDLPTCDAGGGGNRRCEPDENDLVNPGTQEVNPLHVPRIDLVGHRYLSVDNFGVVVGVQGRVLW
jgi:hypothetical protein